MLSLACLASASFFGSAPRAHSVVQPDASTVDWSEMGFVRDIRIPRRNAIAAVEVRPAARGLQEEVAWHEMGIVREIKLARSQELVDLAAEISDEPETKPLKPVRKVLDFPSLGPAMDAFIPKARRAVRTPPSASPLPLRRADQ